MWRERALKICIGVGGLVLYGWRLSPDRFFTASG
jgi:hypothetical protein